MPYDPTQLDRTGTAEFYNGEQLDIAHQPSSEHMIETAEFNRQRELAKTAEAHAASMVNDAVDADAVVSEYAGEGVGQLEQIINSSRLVADWVAYKRAEAINDSL